MSTACSPGERRPYRLAGSCGIPPTARAVAANLSVVEPTGAGSFTLWPGDRTMPLMTTPLSFAAGSLRSTQAVLPLDRNGTLLAQPFVAGSGAAHLVIDVTGYFD